MNIDGLGGEIIEMLIENNFLNSLSDIYFLKEKKAKLIGLTKFKKTIDSSKKFNNH